MPSRGRQGRRARAARARPHLRQRAAGTRHQATERRRAFSLRMTRRGARAQGRCAPSTSDAGTTGSLLYDFYWGMELYPRLGRAFDLKTWTNCRMGMMGWAVLALCYAAAQARPAAAAAPLVTTARRTGAAGRAVPALARLCACALVGSARGRRAWVRRRVAARRGVASNALFCRAAPAHACGSTECPSAHACAHRPAQCLAGLLPGRRVSACGAASREAKLFATRSKLRARCAGCGISGVLGERAKAARGHGEAAPGPAGGARGRAGGQHGGVGAAHAAVHLQVLPVRGPLLATGPCLITGSLPTTGETSCRVLL
jgi:hypothetical protein